MSNGEKVEIRDYSLPNHPRVMDVIVKDGVLSEISMQHLKGKHKISMAEINRQIKKKLGA